ncbi:MAG TPA: hypothetical protein VG102_01570 [Candidatus Paceibacterota bacterium]|nr:hypothetical protein [Candidatus Paceibacterota bacterium]
MAIIVVIVLAVMAILLYSYSQTILRPATQYSSTDTVFSTLMSSNSEFAQGTQLSQTGQYDQALPYYKQALSSASDPAQEGEIAFKIAVVTEKSGGYSGYLAAIPLLKAVAANTSYTNITRAYAVQEMGLMFYTYADPKITAAIFGDSPYTSLYVQNDTALSYRHLFEYAASFYPLALSDLRVASWYANELASSNAASTSTQAYTSIIQQQITAANTDITRMKSDPNEEGYVPTALMREALIAGDMQLAGTTSFGDVDALFKQDLDLYAADGMPQYDAFARYNYASLLYRLYGSSRLSDVTQILSPLYASKSYKGSSFEEFLRNERANVTGEKAHIIQLAKVDPAFKQYLETLGWTSSDFSS